MHDDHVGQDPNTEAPETTEAPIHLTLLPGFATPGDGDGSAGRQAAKTPVVKPVGFESPGDGSRPSEPQPAKTPVVKPYGFDTPGDGAASPPQPARTPVVKPVGFGTGGDGKDNEEATSEPSGS